MKKIFKLVLLSLLAYSCSYNESINENGINNAPIIQRSSIPLNSMSYTSANELDSLYENSPNTVIHYKIARWLASVELLAGANMITGYGHLQGWYLTPLPKVVYNYNNTPKYYEFGYVVNNEIVATITTYAQREIDGVIAYVFNHVLDYACSDVDYYMGDYPNRYYGINGICSMQNCEEDLEYSPNSTASTDEDESYFMYQMMSEYDINGMENDLNDLDENMDEELDNLTNYWDLIDTFFGDSLLDKLLNETWELENLILNSFIEGRIEEDSNSEAYYISRLIEELEYELNSYTPYILPEYDDYRLKLTHWEGFCGPAACAWVYRGKYTTYNNVYLPIYNDGTRIDDYYNHNENQDGTYYKYSDVEHSDNVTMYQALDNFVTRSFEADNGLAACFYDNTVPFFWDNEWKFPLYHSGLNNGFREATNDAYHVKFTCKPYKWITERYQPVIIAIDCNHYIVAFGTGVTKKTNGKIKDKFFLVTDNGNTIAPTYRPYMRRYNFWNLHYGLCLTQ